MGSVPCIRCSAAATRLELWGIVSKPNATATFTWHKLLGPYLLVIGGVIAHLAAENLKQDKAGVPILAINDLLAWLNLSWVGLAYSFIPVIIVVVGLSVLDIGATGHDLTLWLAAGYSVDSIAGLVLNRFDTGSVAYAQLKNALDRKARHNRKVNERVRTSHATGTL